MDIEMETRGYFCGRTFEEALKRNPHVDSIETVNNVNLLLTNQSRRLEHYKLVFRQILARQMHWHCWPKFPPALLEGKARRTTTLMNKTHILIRHLTVAEHRRD
jgi:hypothetical protein